MFWLRRIPTETRIVVVVVFLALFQAILLSLFGLTAISNERKGAEDRLAADAMRFVKLRLAHEVEGELSDRADRAVAAAFDRRQRNWPDEAEGLFVEGYLVEVDGTIRDPLGNPLYRPGDLLDADDRAARTEAERQLVQFRRFAVPDNPAEKARQDLELARQFPFARDENDPDKSFALLLASSPLFVDPPLFDLQTLRSARWIGVLNRAAGHLPAASAESFLERLDGAAAGVDGYSGIVTAQEERESPRLVTLIRLVLDLRALRRTALYSGRGPGESAFFVRYLGEGAPMQVLAVDLAVLDLVIKSVVARARPSATATGLKEIGVVRGAEGARGSHVTTLPDMPGYVAFAEVSRAAVRARARTNERFYWYIIAFSVAGIFAGGFLTARVVMRELRLAKLKSGFVSNVSHELKTPLTSIRMFTDMLRSGNIDTEAERQECLTVIAQESERLVRLIQRVLDFSRLDARKRRFTWTTAPLDELVRAEADRFVRATGIDADSFRLEFAADQPAVSHDPEAFAEVISNLLSNAYKYSPADERNIRVRLEPHRGRLQLVVEDNGEGVPIGERTKIFEQFYRAEDYLTRGVEGTGLGLSIARSIVRAHGGRILVEDRVGGGGRFVVVLPIAGRARTTAQRTVEAAK
ncbi:MAG: ATP-binding protein [Planctomycetota bacterium]